jgi:hypothetical protein
MPKMTAQRLLWMLQRRGYHSRSVFMSGGRRGALEFYLAKDCNTVFATLFGENFMQALSQAVLDLEHDHVEICEDRIMCGYQLIEWIRQRRYVKHQIPLAPLRPQSVESPYENC